MSNLFSRYFSNGVDYIEEQQNEIEALRAIYYDEFVGIFIIEDLRWANDGYRR